MLSWKNFCFIFVCVLTIFIAKASEEKACLEKGDLISFLNTAANFLSKADEAYSTCSQDDCCERVAKTYNAAARKMILAYKENYTNCITGKEPDDKPKELVEKFNDCSEILQSGRRESGVYSIYPSETNEPGKELKVYCDMKTDFGGWTVIQRRGKYAFQRNFFLTWDYYKQGFGNISEEFWLGNENIRVLCHKECDMRIDVTAKDGTKGYSLYNNFKISGDSYNLQIGRQTGNMPDSMRNQQGFAFTTKDRGLIEWANMHEGGWWYSASNEVNLNGRYLPGEKGFNTVYWVTFKDFENLAYVDIKVRP